MFEGKLFFNEWRHEPESIYKFSLYVVLFLMIWIIIKLLEMISTQNVGDKLDIIVLLIFVILVCAYLLKWGNTYLVKNKKGMLFITSERGYLQTIDDVKTRLHNNSIEFKVEESSEELLLLFKTHLCTFFLEMPRIRIDISPMQQEDGIYLNLGPVTEENTKEIINLIDILEIK